VKAAPLGYGHPKIEVPGPPGWGFYNRLVTYLGKAVELTSSKEITG